MWCLEQSAVLRGKSEEKFSENYIKGASRSVLLNSNIWFMTYRRTKWVRLVENVVECIKTKWL
jgi:hypothetical protein